MLHCKLLVWWILTTLCDAQFNKYITHFEPLTYNSEEIHSHHLRHERSINSNPCVNIKFHAHGRHFHLRLRRDVSIFAPDLQVDSPTGILNQFNTSHIYEGTLWGEENTKAFGSIRNGIFDGNIHTEKGTYYVERTNKYFSDERAQRFHSLIYHERDIKDHHSGFGGCGITDDVLKWMHNISNSAVEEDSTTSNLKLNKPKNKDIKLTHYFEDYRDINARIRREVPTQRVCSLYIQTDTLLWDHIHNQEKDPTKTREEITSLIAQHVKAVNHIYQKENFTKYQGIKFVVQRITINDSSACDTEEKIKTNHFCSRNIDVSNFLNLNSQMNHDAFCLAYIFTYRDFSEGTLGLAWVASPQGASGGVCEKYKLYSENVNGRPVQIKRSLNTGIITFVNYNTRVPLKVSQLTLAHEIGHNFGSPHDFPDECRPGGSKGNYIMFASATSGDRPNNIRFSHCSIGNMSAVLEALFANEKRLCFQEDKGAFCGNKIVEVNEQCDCGYNEEECNDKCCYPRQSVLLPNDKKQCTRRPGTKCSALCPPSVHKPNYTTVCNEKTRVCLAGECVGSICLQHAKEECFLSKSGGTPEKLCELSCQNKGDPTTCIPQMDSSNNAIKLSSGAPCDDFRGYCDVFQKCRAVHADGPLARLKNLLFNPNTLMTVEEWITVSLNSRPSTSKLNYSNFSGALVGRFIIRCFFIIVMGAFIKCCAVHTPSSNPKQPPARRISDTLRQPAQSLRRKFPRQHRTVPQLNQAPPTYPETLGLSQAPNPRRPGPSQGGLAHGYGESSGHYNRPKKGQAKLTAHDSYAAAYPGGNRLEMRKHKV
uniref:ADAM10 endopeptidase n=1 Tax=Strigamia maritima TaxID=126957 RepID=T1IMD0_STRMM